MSIRTMVKPKKFFIVFEKVVIACEDVTGYKNEDAAVKTRDRQDMDL